jgi:adenosylmethionine-8-amino-7-oxononanoate aminotransferase
VRRAPAFDDPACFDTAIGMVEQHRDTLAAVVIEPSVQAAAGMQLADLDGLARLGRACRDRGVLLMCDEIATGFGRTGTLFASDAIGLRPDLLCLGKGLTAGYLPMSVTVASDTVYRGFLGDDLGERTLYHGHSYAGNALAAAVALRHLELIEAWDVLANVRERSDELAGLLHDRIASKPTVRDVRLRGLMGGVELAPPGDGLRWGRRVSAAAVDRGVLLRPIGDTVILMPPLTITSPELHRIVGTLAEAIDDVTGDAS